jgi:tripartite-type tricarboxylate transporter receptor subunit TctC
MTPRPTRRALLGGSLSLLAAPALGQGARGPVRLMVGFPAGGVTDVIARALATPLGQGFAPSVLVENRAGAGGRIAAEAVKGAAPDGQTILVTPASAMTIYPHIYPTTLRYDPLRDFLPVTTTVTFPFGLAVPMQHPARSLAQYLDWARAEGEVPFGSPAAGSSPHFLGAALNRAAGLRLSHVPYRGSAPVVQDLMANTLTTGITILTDLQEGHLAGRLRVLAATTAERGAALPEVPTFRELGLDALTYVEWTALFLPARAPEEVVQRLHRSCAEALAQPALRAHLERLGFQMEPSDPAALAARIRREHARWGETIAASGFRIEE